MKRKFVNYASFLKRNSQLQLVDLANLNIDGLAFEALATMQIEGEVLHPQSVRQSAAARLGLVAARLSRTCG